MESSESFQVELKKHCKRAVDDETFQKLVDRQYEILKKEYEDRQKLLQATAPKVQNLPTQQAETEVEKSCDLQGPEQSLEQGSSVGVGQEQQGQVNICYLIYLIHIE